MTRAEILSLLTQAAAALTSDPQTPAQWTEEDRQRLIDIHAATVSQKRTAGASTVTVAQPVQETREIPMFTSIPPSLDQPIKDPEPKKKGFWGKFGGKTKTVLVAIGAGGGGAALNAIKDQAMEGNINPVGLATSAIGAAIAGAIAHRMEAPKKDE